jgi:hypothetical protein
LEYLKENKREMAHKLHDPEPCKCKLENFIDHDYGCAKYENFYRKLVETKDPGFGLEVVIENRNLLGFLRAPL